MTNQTKRMPAKPRRRPRANRTDWKRLVARQDHRLAEMRWRKKIAFDEYATIKGRRKLLRLLSEADTPSVIIATSTAANATAVWFECTWYPVEFRPTESTGTWI